MKKIKIDAQGFVEVNGVRLPHVRVLSEEGREPVLSVGYGVPFRLPPDLVDTVLAALADAVAVGGGRRRWEDRNPHLAAVPAFAGEIFHGPPASVANRGDAPAWADALRSEIVDTRAAYGEGTAGKVLDVLLAALDGA